MPIQLFLTLPIPQTLSLLVRKMKIIPNKKSTPRFVPKDVRKIKKSSKNALRNQKCHQNFSSFSIFSIFAILTSSPGPKKTKLGQIKNLTTRIVPKDVKNIKKSGKMHWGTRNANTTFHFFSLFRFLPFWPSLLVQKWKVDQIKI